MRTYTLLPCPWCKSPAKLDQDCNAGWYVSCSFVRCPVLPISADYKFAHMAAMAWNCCGQSDRLPALMPAPTEKHGSSN
ncbi:hypothetical protein TU84_13070 [Pseudomonas helleri]|nr:hypothetical protein TU84_13070 [Pseudomonas helleri]